MAHEGLNFADLVTVVADEREDRNRWVAAAGQADLGQDDDPIVCLVAQAVRHAYGELELFDAVVPDADPEVAENFDLAAIRKAFVLGLPDPDEEGKKPPQLTNYRSEVAEMVAWLTLQTHCDLEFTPALHATKGNANQPILGFDGWGLISADEGSYVLVLVQVKGSEEDQRPPSVADELRKECSVTSITPAKLARTLSACLMRCKGTPYQDVILKFMEALGREEQLEMRVAPVIVRGRLPADLEDVGSLRKNCSEFLPASANGLSVSVGAPLAEFGRAVLGKAREE